MSDTDRLAPPNWPLRLAHIADACTVHNWDSYDAEPVHDAAIAVADNLARSLDVGPTVSGGITVSLASEAIVIELDERGEVRDFQFSLDDLVSRVRTFVSIARQEAVAADQGERRG